jgi:copper homeostasis protein
MNTNPFIVEIAAFTPNAAIAAASSGANRVELCSGYSEGGLSPSAGTIMKVRESISIPIHVMIRPRIGDFIYNLFEKECILQDIAFCKQVGIDGIVIGALTSEGEIDVDFIKRVVSESQPMSVTFHRAFDLCSNLFESMEVLILCGVNRILTSGGKPNVEEGLEVIAALVSQAEGRIVILPGGGVNSENANRIIEETNVVELHLSAKGLVKSKMKSKSEVNLCSEDEVSDTSWYECDAKKLKDLLKSVHNLV